jgi:hypothetical protein
MEHAIDSKHEATPRKPSTAFLVVLNALLFLALLLPPLNPMGLVLAIPVTALFLVVSGVWQAIWVFLDHKFGFHNIVRCFGLVFPATVFLVLPYLGVLPEQPINKQEPATSKTGKYKAYVHAKPGGWTVEIQDRTGKTLHVEQTDFVPHLNVYWIWGADERFWLYNSDDGSIHCWYARFDGAWQHVIWDHGHTRETDLNLGDPPTDLYPDYARRPRT